MESDQKNNHKIESQNVPKAIFKAFLDDLETKEISDEVISNLKDVLMAEQTVTEVKIKSALFVNTKL